MALLKGSLILTATAARPAAEAQNASRPAAVAHNTSQVATKGALPVATAEPNADVNLNNILKLVPAEVVAPYIAGLDQALAANARFGPSLWFALCLLVCMALRAQATRPRASTKHPWYREVSWAVVAVSGVAFFIWAHAVAGRPPLVPVGQGLAGLAAMLFGVLAPLLVPAQTVLDRNAAHG